MTFDCIKRSIRHRTMEVTILHSSILAATFLTCWGVLHTEDSNPQDGPEQVTRLRRGLGNCASQEMVLGLELKKVRVSSSICGATCEGTASFCGPRWQN